MNCRAVRHDGTPKRRHQPQDGLEQRSLAGAVGTEKTEHLAGIERKADVVADDHSAVAEGQLFYPEIHRATYRHPLCDTASTQMKNGVPINAVSTPSGTSIVEIVRANVSTPSK